MTGKHYDLAVIGGGPGGYEAAFEAARLGLKAALIEKEALGGTCLNHGCIPTKSLLHAADLYDEMRGADRFGVHAEGVTFDMKRMKEQKDETVRTLRDGIGAEAKRKRVTVYEGTGVIESPNEVRVGDERLTARFILIATGSRAFVPPIPGADLPGVVTSDGLLEQTEPCRRLVIIGGGVIGVEFASLYSRLGAEVTVMEALPRVLSNMDSELSQSLKMQLKRADFCAGGGDSPDGGGADRIVRGKGNPERAGRRPGAHRSGAQAVHRRTLRGTHGETGGGARTDSHR